MAFFPVFSQFQGSEMARDVMNTNKYLLIQHIQPATKRSFSDRLDR